MNILKPNETTFGKTGIPVHDTWDVMDATKLKTLMSCPRDFFFSYILGWRTISPNIHLGFGHAWHAAEEVLQTEGTSAAAVTKAYLAFIKDYKEQMEMDEDVLQLLHVAKNPANALLGLSERAKIWQDDPALTHYVEVSGTAPINEEGRLIHVKLDTIRKRGPGENNAGKYYSLEHKTTTRFTEAWQEQWQYDFQVGAYDHFLKCLYEPDEVEGVVINGAVFNKLKRRFPRFPIIITPTMWELWIYEANYWWNNLELNMTQLYDTSPDDRVMFAFPRNSASCSKFGCKHPYLCSIKSNPLQRIETPPLEYGIEFWDPRKREENPVQKGDVTISIKKDLT